MDALKAAVARRDTKAARLARSAAWDEVGKLPPYLTTQVRSDLYKCKLLIRGIEQARRAERRP
ncbi:hypothetical protein ACGF5F_32735 [Streptomyces sp. NPDC047821]|uniref:hypothetical protein n=1 Tax=Streptomyces sp. NPDC047821 TaxID=3365488 RepID=UPI0037233712